MTWTTSGKTCQLWLTIDCLESNICSVFYYRIPKELNLCCTWQYLCEAVLCWWNFITYHPAQAEDLQTVTSIILKMSVAQVKWWDFMWLIFLHGETLCGNCIWASCRQNISWVVFLSIVVSQVVVTLWSVHMSLKIDMKGILEHFFVSWDSDLMCATSQGKVLTLTCWALYIKTFAAS